MCMKINQLLRQMLCKKSPPKRKTHIRVGYKVSRELQDAWLHGKQISSLGGPWLQVSIVNGATGVVPPLCYGLVV